MHVHSKSNEHIQLKILRLGWAIQNDTPVFLRCFTDPIRVSRISENCHRVSRIRDIGSLQVHTGYLTFSLKNLDILFQKYSGIT